MPLNANEQLGYNAISQDLSGTRTKCSGTSIKWNRAAIVRGNAVAYSTAAFSGADEAMYPRWTRDVQYVTNEKSSKDSEIKVLVDLEDHGLMHNDTIVIFGDDGPCPSCRNAIKQYRRYYQQQGKTLNIVVIYTVATYTQKNGIWPNGGQYGHGNPITDIQYRYYYRV